jgi:hypothetical protein
MGAGLTDRMRAELLRLPESCFVRTQTRLQAGRYVSALVSEMPRRTGGRSRSTPDRTPDRTQRLLNRAAWGYVRGDEPGSPVRGGGPGCGCFSEQRIAKSNELSNAGS